jgi:hypothetical protein
MATRKLKAASQTVKAKPLRPTTMKLPVELLRVARVYAINHNTTVQAMVAEALSEYLRRHGEEVGK